jgi:hypothetical protein
MDADLEGVVKQYHQAVEAFVSGDSSPQERLFSRREDVTRSPIRWGRQPAGGAKCRRLCTGRALSSATARWWDLSAFRGPPRAISRTCTRSNALE